MSMLLDETRMHDHTAHGDALVEVLIAVNEIAVEFSLVHGVPLRDVVAAEGCYGEVVYFTMRDGAVLQFAP